MKPGSTDDGNDVLGNESHYHSKKDRVFVRGIQGQYSLKDELARLLLQVAGEEQPVIQLTPEERADLTEADAEIARGEFATDEQMRSILAKRTV